MFEYLYGKIYPLTDGTLVVEIAGVGFKLHVPISTRDRFREGENGKIFVKMCVREDSIKLYGFADAGERNLFEKLQTISGIGPALALNIVSAGEVESLHGAILNEDLAFFKKVKGVGPKMARRIVLELKGVLPQPGPSLPAADARIRGNAVNALHALGYQRQDAETAVAKVLAQLPGTDNLEEVVREALQLL